MTILNTILSYLIKRLKNGKAGIEYETLEWLVGKNDL